MFKSKKYFFLKKKFTFINMNVSLGVLWWE